MDTDQGNMIGALVKNDVEFTWTDTDGSKLHMAASSGDFHQIYAYLIYRRQEVDQPRNDSKTPLMLAVAHNCPQTVTALLAYGANIDLVDRNGESALQMVFNLKATHPEVIEKFLYEVQRQEADTKGLVERLYNAGCTLYQAALLRKIEVMEGLLKCGVDINSADFRGRTALHTAVDLDDVNMIRWLLDNGANVNTLDEDGLGALCMAAAKGDTLILLLLLKHGADTNVKAFDCGLTPLIAVFENTSDERGEQYDDCAELLLQYGAVPSQKIGDYPTILDEALANGSYDRINLLICYVALREMQGVSIAKTMMQCKLDESEYAVSGFQEYYEMCQQTLRIKIFESLTLFDLLTASENKFRIYMRNESFRDTVIENLTRHREINELYTYYSSTLMHLLYSAPGAHLENEAVSVICKLFGSNFNHCYVFAKEVIGYLNMRDLTQLIEV